MIGNPLTYNVSSTAATNVSVCLPITLSIPRNLSAYPNYDVAKVSGSYAVAQYASDVKFTGDQVCASAPLGTGATYVPVIRSASRAVIIQVAAVRFSIFLSIL